MALAEDEVKGLGMTTVRGPENRRCCRRPGAAEGTMKGGG